MIFQSKFEDVLKKSNIAKEKMYFEFLVSPIPKPEEINNYKCCQRTYSEV